MKSVSMYVRTAAAVLPIAAMLSAGQAYAGDTCLTGIKVDYGKALENVTGIKGKALVEGTKIEKDYTTVTEVTDVDEVFGVVVDIDTNNEKVVKDVRFIPKTGEFLTGLDPKKMDVVTDVHWTDSGASATGTNGFACGPDALAEGQNASAFGDEAHADGRNATATGQNAHAHGADATAVGQSAFADGENATAVGQGAHADGYNATAVGENSHADGDNATAVGQEAHAHGRDATAVGQNSFADGRNATALGQDAWADGTNATAVGENSHAGGRNATALGQEAHAHGREATAVGQDSLAIGGQATAIGQGAEADGSTATAVGQGAYADGRDTTAIGQNSLAIGRNSTAVGQNAFADGRNATAVGTDAYAAKNGTAVGQGTQANGEGSVAIGRDSQGNSAVANRPNEFALGTSNHTYTAGGITSDLSRSRQSGPLEVVTTDKDGHLASDGGQIFKSLGEQAAGIAIAMALENPDLVGNERFGLSANLGFFEGNTALGVAMMGVLGHNFAGYGERWAISGGVGVSLNEEGFGGHDTDRTVAGRAGVQVTW